MDTVFAVSDNVLDFIDPCFTSITSFQSTAGSEANIMDCEYYGTKEWQVFLVEGTIDKDILIEARQGSIDRRSRHFEDVV